VKFWGLLKRVLGGEEKPFISDDFGHDLHILGGKRGSFTANVQSLELHEKRMESCASKQVFGKERSGLMSKRG